MKERKPYKWLTYSTAEWVNNTSRSPALHPFKYNEFRQFLKLGSNVCTWQCPVCGGRCSGVHGHYGEHQCPIHFDEDEGFNDYR